MQTSDIFIYHHLGLGDHIICNGLVRSYVKKYNKVYLFCKESNLDSVRDMYSDLNIPLIPGDDSYVHLFIRSNPNLNYLIVGFNMLNDIEPFDEQFYKLAKLAFVNRWDEFHCPASSKDTILFNLINPPTNYALVHEDASRGYTIDKSKISLPIVYIDKKENFSLPNYRILINKAKEIHVIDSSAMFLIDSLPLTEDPALLFVHRYARNNVAWNIPTLRKNWVIL